jgi:hypothetical protein
MLLVAPSIVLVAFYSWARSNTGQEGSPKEVVGLFRKMDSHGQRLTKEGWLNAAALFVRPDQPTGVRSFWVVTDELVSEQKVTGDRAEVWTEFTEWGTVDPAARFSRVIGYPAPVEGIDAPREPIQGPIRTRHQYKVVLTNHYWELTREGASLREMTGNAAWRIESIDPGPLVEMDFALRYLTKLRNNSTDPAIRKNAEMSIEAVKRLYRSSAGLVH